MKHIFTLCCLLMLQAARAQAPTVVTAATGVLEPNDDNQEAWQHNAWQGKVFYQGTGNPVKLCTSDGTAAGTRFVKDIGSGTIVHVLPARDFVYIITNEVVLVPPSFKYQTRLWRSDGTAAGTILVKTMDQISSATIGHNWTSNRRDQNFSIVGNTMYFGGYSTAAGQELWVTDGTEAGTKMVVDIKAGAGPSNPQGFYAKNGVVYFSCTQTGLERKLWKTDGTAVGTVQIPVAEPFFISDYAVGIINGKMVFFATNTTDGLEPYVSDGTAAGTFMLRNINPSGNSSLPAVQSTEWVTTTTHSFFIANNGTANALWRTDGTVAGTIQLTPNAWNVSSNVSSQNYTDHDDGNLWMIQYASSGFSALYRSNGTPEGTFLASNQLYIPINLKLYRQGAWFAARPAGTFANVEPWRSGGNAATTRQAFDIAPGFPMGAPTLLYSSTPHGFFELNGNLYFFASGNGTSDNINLYRYQGGFTFTGGTPGGQWTDSSNWSGAMPPGLVDTANIAAGTPHALQVSGGRVWAGVLQLQPNATVQIAAPTDTLSVGTALLTATGNQFTGNGVLALVHPQADTMPIQQGFTATNLLVEGRISLLQGNLQVGNGIALRNGGRLMLNQNNLLLTGSNATAVGDAQGYLVTNGTGSLQLANMGSGGRTGNLLFPVGPSATSFNPATISNSGANDALAVRVAEGISNSYTGNNPGQPFTSGAVNRTWFISEQTPGGSNAVVALQWNAGDELPGFDRNASLLGHYTGGGWTYNNPGPPGGSNPYTYSRAGITGFSPFGVLNSNATLPLRFLDVTARHCPGSKVCIQWRTANETGVSHFDVQASADGIKFTSLLQVPARNSSLNAYEATEQVTGLGSGRRFYRILQVDQDGREMYSPIAALLLQGNKVLLYPTLVRQQLTVQNQTDGRITLQLIHAGGSVHQVTAMAPGTQNISLEALATGTWMYRVFDEKGALLTTGKLIRQ